MTLASTSSSAHQTVDSNKDAPNATRRDLTSWWKRFNMRMRREEEKAAKRTDGQGDGDEDPQPRRIFGIPLQDSIKYANVAISLTDGNGQSFIYGYVPIVVAKCGVYLKEKATEIEGIFRLSGSTKRIKDLQIIFNSPDRYGKGLDWTGFTVHDAANILRRYLNQLPEPIIPLEFYRRFRDPLVQLINQSAGLVNGPIPDGDVMDEARLISIYQQVITELPPLNRQLLLYILDLLAVFASKSDINRMTSTNLAAIFQPGMLSHPQHDMDPDEYRLSQDVLVFLIENQDHFLIGMRGTAADEETVRDVQGGGSPPAAARAPATPPPSSLQAMSKGGVPRTPPNAGGGGDNNNNNKNNNNDNVKRFGSGVRRNLSVSSKHSASSPGPVPGSPGVTWSGTGNGVHRSNTLPAKKSPGLKPNRYSRPSEPPTPPSAGFQPPSEHGGTDSSPAREVPGAFDPDHTSRYQPQETPATPTASTAATGAGGEPPQIEIERQTSADTQAPATMAGFPQMVPLAPTPTAATAATAATQTTASSGGGGGGGGERSSRDSLPLDVPLPHRSSIARTSSPGAGGAGGPGGPGAGAMGIGMGMSMATTPPVRERNLSSLFSRSPTSDGERRADGKGPNKLRKKRMSGMNNASAHSSTQSLHES